MSTSPSTSKPAPAPAPAPAPTSTPAPAPTLAPSPTGLTIAELETTYDQLATALDAAGPDKRELLLVKLALLSAQELANPTRFTTLLTRAQKDL